MIMCWISEIDIYSKIMFLIKASCTQINPLHTSKAISLVVWKINFYLSDIAWSNIMINALF